MKPAEYACKLAEQKAKISIKATSKTSHRSVTPTASDSESAASPSQRTTRTKPPKAAIGNPDAGHTVGQVHVLKEDEQESAPAPPEVITLNRPQAVELPEVLQCDPAARAMTIEQQDQMNSMARLVQKYKIALKRSEDNVELLMTMSSEQQAAGGALREQMRELLAWGSSITTTASERVAQTQPAAASAAAPHSDV